MIELHNYYITPEEYNIAEKNGISKSTLYRRVYYYGWEKERAINTKPIINKRCEWSKLAWKNGISHAAYYSRVNKLGWSRQKAATTPIQKRKYSLELIETAKQNGISYQRVRQRIRDGWNEHDASTIKPMTKAESGRLRHSKRLERKI